MKVSPGSGSVVVSVPPILPFRTVTTVTDIVLDGPGNNDAHGHVVLSFLTGTGTVTFSGGTGRRTIGALAQATDAEAQLLDACLLVLLGVDVPLQQ